MAYKHISAEKIPQKSVHGINLDVFNDIGDCGIVTVSVEEGHNQEFYDKISSFTYIILEGTGSFFLDDEEVIITKGDMISIPPKTRIYYKGKMSMILITNPAWRPENEVETRPNIW
jgi:mannose-6-phosphate isomerase-like protein (cupin superfamily)